MKKHTISYYLVDRSISWPDAIKGNFEMNDWGVVHLIKNSDRQNYFVQKCIEAKVENLVSYDEYIYVSKEDIVDDKYYFLFTESLDYVLDDIWKNVACDECNFANTKNSSIKLNKIESIKTDLSRLILGPQILVISEKTKDIWEKLCGSGEVEFSPIFYNGEKTRLHHAIVKEINVPPNVGNVNIKSVCKKCKSVNIYYPNIINGFRCVFDDVKGREIFSFSKIRSNDIEYGYRWENIVVSGKIMKSMLDNSISGLSFIDENMFLCEILT